MVWDSQNRMVDCTIADANDTETTYAYSSDGLRRYKEVVGGGATWYAYDGQSMVREFLNGSVSATYLTGPRGPEYRRNASGNVTWYVYDGLGSVLAEVNPSGTLTAARGMNAPSEGSAEMGVNALGEHAATVGLPGGQVLQPAAGFNRPAHSPREARRRRDSP